MGKMYLLPKARQLTAEEITRAKTHSPKSLNKTLPGHAISGSPSYYIGKIIDFFLLPIVKKYNTYTGHPAFHTTDRTSGFF